MQFIKKCMGVRTAFLMSSAEYLTKGGKEKACIFLMVILFSSIQKSVCV